MQNFNNEESSNAFISSTKVSNLPVTTKESISEHELNKPAIQSYLVDIKKQPKMTCSFSASASEQVLHLSNGSSSVGMPLTCLHQTFLQKTAIKSEYPHSFINDELAIHNSCHDRIDRIRFCSPEVSVHSKIQNSLPTTSSKLTEHFCSVCGDKVSGKHYGVYSCEGCKGFFKRTVRKSLHYSCRENKQCVINKKQRNRCQYCRFHKCLNVGMKMEAVQEERQKQQKPDKTEHSAPTVDMPVDKILEAEVLSEYNLEDVASQKEISMLDRESRLCKIPDLQLQSVIGWAKLVPLFLTLCVDDQVALLSAGLNELLMASSSYSNIRFSNQFILPTGLRIQREDAQQNNVGTTFDLVVTEFVESLRDLNMDRTELGCLRAIMLFNPDAPRLTNHSMVKSLREKVFVSLEHYCKVTQPHQPLRFAKLLLRLPALRSISLKCSEHMFFCKLIDHIPIDQFLLGRLRNDCSSC